MKPGRVGAFHSIDADKKSYRQQRDWGRCSQGETMAGRMGMRPSLSSTACKNARNASPSPPPCPPSNFLEILMRCSVALLPHKPQIQTTGSIFKKKTTHFKILLLTNHHKWQSRGMATQPSRTVCMRCFVMMVASLQPAGFGMKPQNTHRNLCVDDCSVAQASVLHMAR